MKIRFRNANIGVAVASVFLLVGGYLFKDSEGLLALAVFGGFLCGFAVMQLLNDRGGRKRNHAGR